MPYENIGGEVRCIVDEVPFEIPDSWEWVRLGELFLLEMGQSPEGITVSEFNDGMEFHQGKVYFGNKLLNKSNQKTTTPKKIAPANSVLLCVRAPVGKVNITEREICIGRGLCSIKPLGNMGKNYVFHLLEVFENIFIKKATGTTFVAITGEVVKSQLIPVPPLAEQQRIVAKLEETLPYIENYNLAHTKIEKLNKEFPEQLKKSILQWAVQGKLVEQDENDEPASVLLERIREEKAQLIKDKKIKKDKQESIIFKRDNSHYEKIGNIERCIDDEIPFDIPDSWEWCRLGHIVFNCGQLTPTSDFCYIDIGSIDNHKQILSETENIVSADKAPSRARKIVKFNDILYSTVRPYLHNMCIVDKEFSLQPIASTGFAVLTCHTGVYNQYLFRYLMSPDFDNYANHTDNSKGVAYPAINDDRLYRALVPMPPFVEQQRIVEQIEIVLSIISNL